jgi:hypothetical protein
VGGGRDAVVLGEVEAADVSEGVELVVDGGALFAVGFPEGLVKAVVEEGFLDAVVDVVA